MPVYEVPLQVAVSALPVPATLPGWPGLGCAPAGMVGGDPTLNTDDADAGAVYLEQAIGPHGSPRTLAGYSDTPGGGQGVRVDILGADTLPADTLVAYRIEARLRAGIPDGMERAPGPPGVLVELYDGTTALRAVPAGSMPNPSTMSTLAVVGYGPWETSGWSEYPGPGMEGAYRSAGLNFLLTTGPNYLETLDPDDVGLERWYYPHFFQITQFVVTALLAQTAEVVAPPRRQRQRDDGLTSSAVRQRSATSRQRSVRQRGYL